MSDRKEFKVMNCVLCGRVLPYPECFPNRAMAECWRCCWDAHTRAQHPRVIKRIQRDVRKRARRLKEAELRQAMTEREREILLGGSQ